MIDASAQAQPIANLANHMASRNRGRGSRFEGSGAIRAPRLDVKVRIINGDSKVKLSKAVYDIRINDRSRSTRQTTLSVR